MNMSRLRRALERGNKVVLFDKVPDPLCPGSKILYGTYRIFEKFEDLQEDGVDFDFPHGAVRLPAEAQ